MGMPRAMSASISSARTSGPSARTAGRAARMRSQRAGSSPRPARRRTYLRATTGPSRPSSQRTSSAQSMCSVPRIAQVRTTERSCEHARTTSSTTRPSLRARTPSREERVSCAWIASAARHRSVRVARPRLAEALRAQPGGGAHPPASSWSNVHDRGSRSSRQRSSRAPWRMRPSLAWS